MTTATRGPVSRRTSESTAGTAPGVSGIATGNESDPFCHCERPTTPSFSESTKTSSPGLPSTSPATSASSSAKLGCDTPGCRPRPFCWRNTVTALDAGSVASTSTSSSPSTSATAKERFLPPLVEKTSIDASREPAASSTSSSITMRLLWRSMRASTSFFAPGRRIAATSRSGGISKRRCAPRRAVMEPALPSTLASHRRMGAVLSGATPIKSLWRSPSKSPTTSATTGSPVPSSTASPSFEPSSGHTVTSPPTIAARSARASPIRSAITKPSRLCVRPFCGMRRSTSNWPGFDCLRNTIVPGWPAYTRSIMPSPLKSNGTIALTSCDTGTSTRLKRQCGGTSLTPPLVSTGSSGEASFFWRWSSMRLLKLLAAMRSSRPSPSMSAVAIGPAFGSIFTTSSPSNPK